MPETLSFNEKLKTLFATELLFTVANGYYINVNSVYDYIPNIEEGKTFQFPIAYVEINDETPDNDYSDKTPATNIVNVTIGIINKTTLETIETDKENIKKSGKLYLRSSSKNSIHKQIGYDAKYLSRTSPVIKFFSHVEDSSKMLVTFEFKIKTQLI